MFDTAQQFNFREDRLAAYEWMRREAPLHETVVNGAPVRIVTRFADVDALLKSPRALVQKEPGSYPAHIGNGAAATFYRLSLPHMDRPDHNQFRRIATSAFNPNSIARMTQWVGDIVEARVEALAGEEEVDIVAALAATIPSDVACDMLHIPRDHAEMMMARVHDLNPIVGQATMTPEILAKADAAAQFYFDYFAAHAADVRGLPEDDLLHILVKAEADGLWDKTAMATTLIGLFIASYHTTMTAIGNAVHAFATHPEQRALLASNPGLAGDFWEEVLRFDSPVHFVHRYASEPMEVAGEEVPRGTKFLLALAAANRDPDQFADADRFDIRRGPGRHLAFAAGAHFCLGAQLSRLEGRFLLQALVERFPDMALSDTLVERVQEFTFPFIRSMRVRLRG